MKANELIDDLRIYGPQVRTNTNPSQDGAAEKCLYEAATKLEAFIALADELWNEANGGKPHRTTEALIEAETKLAVAKRIRQELEQE